MPIGSSSGEYFQDEGDLIVAQNTKERSDAKEMAANETSGDFRSRFGGSEERPLVYITPHVEDRTQQSFGDMIKGYVGEQLTTEKLHAIMQHPFMSTSQTMTANLPIPPANELSNALGRESIASTMPLGASTEAQDALESPGGTNTPGNVSIPKIGDKTPSGETIRFTTSSPLINITDEDIERGINIGLSAGPGTMAGVKAATMKGKLADLGQAQVMESNGIHRDQVLKETGFFRGTDGRWRHEIDDSKAVFDNNWVSSSEHDKISEPITHILDHPELYKAYPQLKNVRVIFDPNYKGAAEWNGRDITMGRGYTDNQGVLMHEVQHAIQDIEGFAKGGAPGVHGKDFNLKYDAAVKDLVPETRDLLEKSDSTGLTPKEEARFEYLKQVINKYHEYRDAGNAEAREYYKRLAGETEARNVDTRLLMSEESRRKLTPWNTEDISRHRQIPVDEPALTSAYGVIDPLTGKLIK